MTRNKARKLIEQFAAVEQSFRTQQFLAPAVSGGMVHVRLNQVVCRYKIAPADFSGVGVFEPISYTEAILVREASLIERKKYFERLPAVSLIATWRENNVWYAVAARKGDHRFQIQGLVPIRIATNVDAFDVIVCRFDGQSFWFERSDSRVSSRHANELRKALLDERDPDSIQLSGLTTEHRTAYRTRLELMIQAREARISALESTSSGSEPTEDLESDHSGMERVRDSLAHAGATLRGLRQQRGQYQVTFEVDGQSFTSAIHQDSLDLVSAGVCLDGYDHEFDLTSLVGVLREGIKTRQLDW